MFRYHFKSIEETWSSVETDHFEPKQALMTIERDQWAHPAEFVLSLIGCAVGFGNVWRYPYIAYQNGGGAFLLPYFTVYLLVGIPLYYLEMCLGQFASIGVSKIFRVSRIWKGLGWCICFQIFLSSIYYNMILGWVLIYLFDSFRKRLRWASCDNEWNTVSCRTLETNTTKSCPLLSMQMNSTNNCTVGKMAAAEYFERFVLKQSDSFEHFGLPTWRLSLSLLVAWILVYVCIFKGIKSSGKVVYVTALFPYAILLALIIRGTTLPGSSAGLRFYFLPDWSKMKNIDVWLSATVQVTFSLGIASGTIINYSSFNKFKHKFISGCIIAVLFDCLTSVLAGIAIFSVLGFMADKVGIPINQVVRSGPGLAFIAYPEAIARMPLSQLWSVLFFLMMITLGLDSQFALIDVIVSSIMDTIPRCRSHKQWIVLGVCSLCYLFALPMCAPGGIYYFTLLNEYSSNLNKALSSFFIIIIIIYIYGFDNFMNDSAMMLGRRAFEPYLFFTLCITAPIISLFVFLTMTWGFKTPVVGDYKFPLWARFLGGSITGICFLPIVVFAVHQYIKSWSLTRRNADADQTVSSSPHYLRALRHALAPSSKWGPVLAIHRTGRYGSLETIESNDSLSTITHF